MEFISKWSRTEEQDTPSNSSRASSTSNSKLKIVKNNDNK